jgi:transcriptional regulator NrdR family protein
MGLFHRERNECEECHARFGSYDELIQHAKDAHKQRPIRCLHEKDRLHHEREEKEKKVDARRHKF